MTKSITKTDRLHSLDSLRAIMMLLGVVLHSSETYNVGTSDIWPTDPISTHRFQNYLSAIIHVFRMPIFFMIAGFFGSLLFYERGSKPMIKNRIARIVLPFIVFLCILHPIIWSALHFTIHAFSLELSGIPIQFSLMPTVTYHLWFLYYLALITVLFYVLGLLLRKSPMTAKISIIFEWLIRKRIAGLFIFIVVIFLIMVYRWDYSVPTPLSFIPEVGDLLFFALFYTVGWLLFKSKKLLASFMHYDWLFTISAFLLFTGRFIWSSYIDDVPTGLIHAVVTWLAVFGITGLFIRYGSNHSDRMRYISNASYWVYLIHLPLTIWIPGLIVDLPVPAFVKFTIVLGTTTVICFISYHYLVKNTFIGHFLNGRKYPNQ